MSKIYRLRFLIEFFILFVVVLLLVSDEILLNFRGDMNVNKYTFTESARELQNPRRGFYNLHRFMITDKETDYRELIEEEYKTDTETSLSLIEINLQMYRDSSISEAGMKNIDLLFQALSGIDKQLIIRFVYDWDGENEKYEPDTIDIILDHMEQLADVLDDYKEDIFIIQGLFIGNWGEMNGTKYFSDTDLGLLARQIADVADQSIYLSVRTPAYWRKITGIEKASPKNIDGNRLAGRLSLYNDGILGNESDYGTYRVQEYDGKKRSERKAELDFQDKLCSLVPNGGEVINDNEYNDFDNAVKDLATMHITYLNEGHDEAVLDKWRDAVVIEKGVFQGVDGYTYIKQHLGYRLLIEESDFGFNYFTNSIKAVVTMKNVGFAPLYSEPEISLILYDCEEGEILSYEMEGDLLKLTGGNRANRKLKLKGEIPLRELSDTKYDVYFSIVDSSTGQFISLANEQDAEEHGYCIGSIELLE